MEDNGLILSALKQSNYFLAQYIKALPPEHRFIVLKQYENNNKLIKELEPPLLLQDKGVFLMLHGIEETTPTEENCHDPKILSDDETEIITYFNNYGIEIDRKEFHAIAKAIKGLEKGQIDKTLKKVQAKRHKINNITAYLIVSLKNEQKKNGGGK